MKIEAIFSENTPETIEIKPTGRKVIVKKFGKLWTRQVWQMVDDEATFVKIDGEWFDTDELEVL